MYIYYSLTIKHKALTMAHSHNATFSLAILFFSMLVAPGPAQSHGNVAIDAADGDNAHCHLNPPSSAIAIYPADMEQLQFLLNIKFIEAEWFLHGALGIGVDALDRKLSRGGPAAAGVKKASLDVQTRQIIAELGYQEVGHIRAITQSMGGFPRPAINLSDHLIGSIMDEAMGAPLNPPFDPYASNINFLLASYIFPHITASATVGISFNLMGYVSKWLQASILSVEAGQDAVIRSLLYQHADEVVGPYRPHTVAEFTRRISGWRNGLSGCGDKDDGIRVLDRRQGAERRTISSILGADEESLGFERTPAEVLRIVYGTRSEQSPGGFLPKGGNGTVARGFFEVA